MSRVPASRQTPPPPPAMGWPTADQRDGPPPVEFTFLQLDRRVGHRDPTPPGSFAFSALIHLALTFLLVLFGVPMAGSVGRITLQLSQPEAPERAERIVLAPAIQPQDAVAVVPEQAVPLGEDLLQQPLLPSKSGSSAGGAADTGKGRGAQFFGTSAVGRDFVFVLDASTSMQARRGRRFQRAKEELIRSVTELTPRQRFYVYSFNGKMQCMFGQAPGSERLVPATLDNKSRLIRWLNEIECDSYTDPRMAVYRALAMNPDAVFFLSDGDFNRYPHEDPDVWHNPRDDVFDIVDTFIFGRAQIHTISYEDQRNEPTMRKLAGITGGNHTFVPAPGQGQSVTLRPEPAPGVTPAAMADALFADAGGSTDRNRIPDELRPANVLAQVAAEEERQATAAIADKAHRLAVMSGQHQAGENRELLPKWSQIDLHRTARTIRRAERLLEMGRIRETETLLGEIAQRRLPAGLQRELGELKARITQLRNPTNYYDSLSARGGN